ncbi:HAD family hydrolase [Nocardia stercoris]|uniref:HAD family phosphatase n=1 Tax=Nocardia stercoris TaxID=2483361 RepID=A0A3M2L407_9NOCA|nr:HAD family phosphatase [Nocardia stercoris]RMI32291.1 HAD family phosphatase [Nocardia stercoris]
MTELAGVLWDMDGTLLDSEKLWDVAVRELSLALGGPLTEATRHALVGAPVLDSLVTVFRAVGREPTPAELDEAAAWLEARVSELMDGPIPWRPGAREALAAVRAAGVPMALVTNTNRSITELSLNTLGREWFAATVCGDEVSAPKPAADPYLRAAELLGVDPSACVAVEDSINGSRSAVAAGCVVLVVPCEIVVPPAPGIVFRDTLIGLTVAELAGRVDRIALG